MSNAETSTQHGSFEQEQSRACRQEDGAGGPPWCWWGNCGQRPRSTTMALPLHFGAKAQSHVGSTHDPHCDTQLDGKSGTRLLSIEGEIGSGGNVGAVSSRNQTKFPYSSYKLGRSGAVQIFTFFCVQNPRLQCLVFKWASLSHWQILWSIDLCIWLFTSCFHSFITHKCICALIWAVIFTQSFIIDSLILTFN